ncbi:tetraspanin-8-like [Mastacembelus armatus]|uniref:Tetraspanin n=1 Tax=Mastacembelus armatus TaxID=205130 RepID=A0A7N8YNN9_9TELE|nr:tetraspanin-8-like [Mastacembelus armatus]
MAQVNTCLKRTFTIFNIFFAIVGGFIIGLALLSQIVTGVDGGHELEGRTSGLVLLYVMGIITLMIATMGAYGAHKESRGCLTVFLVCMIIGCLLMLRAGIPAAIARPQLRGFLEDKFRNYVPLDNAPDNVKSVVESLQTNLQCCGLFSNKDWQEYPDSCQCKPEEAGICQSVNSYAVFMMKSKLIYSRPCIPIVVHYVLLVADIVIGVIFTLASLALLGMILSSIMIHQMRFPNNPTMVVTIPTIFNTAPPKYQELQNPPPYC